MCDPDGSEGISAAEFGLLIALPASEAANIIINIEAAAGDSNNDGIINTPGELFQLNFVLSLQFGSPGGFPGLPGPDDPEIELCTITGIGTPLCNAISDGVLTPQEFVDVFEIIGLGFPILLPDAMTFISQIETSAATSNNDVIINTQDELTEFHSQTGNVCG